MHSAESGAHTRRAFRFAHCGVAAASDSRLTTEAVHKMVSNDIRLLAQQNKSARYIFRNRSLPAMKAEPRKTKKSGQFVN